VDLLALSEVRWDYFRTRKQFLLSRFPERWRVLFAQPPGSGREDPWIPRQDGNVTYFTVPFLKPSTKQPLYNLAAATRPGRAAIERVARIHLRRAMARLGVEPDPVVLISNIYAAGALEGLRRRLTVYDFNDSPFQFAGSPRWARGYYDRTLGAADLVFAVSEHWRRQLVTETRAPVVSLGNGVEFERFATRQPEPDDVKSLPRPRVGYLGLLSHFLDFEVLEELRRSRRGGTLLLAGPDSPATRGRLRELAGRDGVKVLGSQPYERVPAILQSLDVGVIPFRAHDPFVRGINPNKVYQYLAAGIPVVTTPLLDLPSTPPLVQFASDPGEFVAAMGRALDAAPGPERCREVARPHDWGELARRMVSEIESRLGAAS